MTALTLVPLGESEFGIGIIKRQFVDAKDSIALKDSVTPASGGSMPLFGPVGIMSLR